MHYAFPEITLAGRGFRGRDSLVVAFTTTSVIGAYHQ